MNWIQAQKDYSHYLKIERGLAQNSIINYLWDIEKLVRFLDQNNITEDTTKIQKETVQQLIYEIAKIISPRSQARIISGLNSFFNYLVFEDDRQDNPMDLIESPKIGRKLPDTLSEEDKFYQNALALNTIESLQAYLKTYPDGLYTTEVETQIQTLETVKTEQENRKKLQLDYHEWEKVLRRNRQKTGDYEDYLEDYPNGRFKNAISKYQI